MVGDGDAMGVAGQVVENLFGAAKRWLGVDHPVLPEQLSEEGCEAGWNGQILLRAVKLQLVLRDELLEFRNELAAEDAAQCMNGQKEAWRRVDPSGAIESKAAGGNDVVDVGMMLKVLSPGVEHAEESDVGSQVLGIAGQFEQ